MATYQETNRVSRPEEAFPGVPAWRMDIAPVGEAPEIKHLDKVWLTSLTQYANGYFDARARQMMPGQSGEFFTIHSSHEEAHRLVRKTAEAIFTVTRDSSNVHLALFPAGAVPIAQMLLGMGYPENRMHTVDISGSQGTETGNARVKGAIHPDLLHPHHHIVIPEDIIDSGHSIEQLIRARNTSGVSVISVWSKNEAARQKLHKNASGIQRELLQHYPITHLPKDLWVLGGAHCMDTGIFWSRVVQYLPKELQRDPRVTMYTRKEERDEWLLRAVRIGPLAYFENQSQEENVIRFFANHAATMLR